MTQAQLIKEVAKEVLGHRYKVIRLHSFEDFSNEYALVEELSGMVATFHVTVKKLSVFDGDVHTVNTSELKLIADFFDKLNELER